MASEDKIRVLSDRIRTHSGSMLTEEAVKTAVVLPFLSALEYDVFNPEEVIPEFCADAVGKKGEKVDYAIKLDGEIRILVECKPITAKLEKAHLAQLYRYFSVTNARFAVLTNGRDFEFYTDLMSPNRLDDRPFFSFDLADVQSPVVSELKKFTKSEFDVEGILKSAHRLKYTSAIKREIAAIMDDPPEEFVRLVISGVYDGRFTQAVREEFTPMVKAAFRDTVRETVQSRLSSALAETSAGDVRDEEPDDGKIITTDEEREGFMIVRAIVTEVMKPSRVFMRDQKSYCAILVDNNNRRPLARLHFNRRIKYIGLFDRESEEKVRIEVLEDIYEHGDRLRQTALQYTQAPD